jgi:hypothetical protein
MQLRSPKVKMIILPVTMILLPVGVALLLGILGTGSTEVQANPVHPVKAPAGEYVSVAWLKDWLVTDFRGTLHGTPAPPVFDVGRLWRLHASGSDMSLFIPPLPEACAGMNPERNAPVRMLAPSRLPDGRLGYIVGCPEAADSPLDDLYMMALDMQTGRGDQLLSYSVLGQRFGVAGYSWNPQITKGIATDGRGLAEQLYWLTPTGFEPLRLPLMRAITPVWSPTGREIAFWGAPEQGLYGIGRADAEFNLYIMQPDAEALDPVLKGFRYPLSMAWSSDGEWLVFTATSVSEGQKGIWLFAPKTRTLQLVALGGFTSLSWSPDGGEVAAAEFMPDSSDTRLVTVEIARLAQKPPMR